MAARDLTTLANVKAYLGITDANSDALLGRLITAMSLAFVEEVGLEIIRQSYTETLDGDDERFKSRGWVGLLRWGISVGFAINLLHSPVIGDPVVTLDGTVVPKRPSLTGSGWVLLDGYRIELADFRFTTGLANIVLSYEAGQHIGSAVDPAESVTVPATPGPYTVQAAQPLGTFFSDVGVAKASDGTKLTKVSGAPAAGQYSVSAQGLYTFNATDQGLAVLLSYAYLPSDVEQCVIEMVVFTYRNRESRGDEVSGNIGGQVVAYMRRPWPLTVQQVIDRWRMVAL